MSKSKNSPLLESYFDFLAPDDIRVKGSRVGIEHILFLYIHKAQPPEEIVKQFSSLTLEQIYATILYYLRHQETVMRYLEEWIEYNRQQREKQAQQPSPAMLRIRELSEVASQKLLAV